MSEGREGRVGQTFLEQFSATYKWLQAPAKRRFCCRKNVNRGMVESHRLSLTLGGVKDRSLDDLEGLQASDYSSYQIFEKDDLVFKLIDLENIRTSRVGYVPRRGIMSPAYIRLQPSSKNAFSRYYFWFFYGAYLNNIFNGMGGGVRQNLTPTDLLEFPVPLPDLETQKTIADFLDRETARIDQLIEKKQGQVEALQGKISNLTNHAVSFGLDKRAELAKTGIPWLPEMPDHWELERAKFLYQEAQRPPLDNDKIITAFRDGQVTLRENRRSRGFTLAIKEVGYQHICAGDLVIHTMDAFAGAIGVSDSNGKATGEYAVCEARSDRVNNQYYALLLRTMAKRNYIYILCPSVRERAPRFRFVRFATVLLPVPPRQEQDDIVEYIETMTETMTVLRNKVQASIDRLKEFRAALITNAVTGQIDVATWGKKGEAGRRMDALKEGAV